MTICMRLAPSVLVYGTGALLATGAVALVLPVRTAWLVLAAVSGLVGTVALGLAICVRLATRCEDAPSALDRWDGRG